MKRAARDSSNAGFVAACRLAKIADFRVHDLRHTFPSRLFMGGLDLVTVKELLGHKNIAVTLRYSHLAPAHKSKARAVLDSTLNGSANYTITIQSTPPSAIAAEAGTGN